jgi:hypothetical protein
MTSRRSVRTEDEAAAVGVAAGLFDCPNATVGEEIEALWHEI